jgi:hypothetical protein
MDLPHYHGVGVSGQSAGTATDTPPEPGAATASGAQKEVTGA